MPGSTRLVLPGEGVYYGEANSDSQRHGRGKLWTIDGRLFDGEWTAGAKHGRGVEIYTDRSTYEGEYYDGQRHGHGVLTYANGDQYDGE